jgi:uncharacterized protein YggU (UPF0235/DUF167 family)
LARIAVRLTPRASRDGIAGFQPGAGDGRARGDVLIVRVTAPPVDGRANDSLLRLLARALDLPPSALRLVAGESARSKVVEVAGLEEAEVRRRLEAAGAR